MDLQFEYSLVSRGIERQILPALRELGIGVTAYGLLSRGLLSGSKPVSSEATCARISRASSGENLQKNAQAGGSSERALPKNTTSPGRNWPLPGFWHQGEDIVPLLGSRTREQLREAMGALHSEFVAG